MMEKQYAKCELILTNGSSFMSTEKERDQNLPKMTFWPLATCKQDFLEILKKAQIEGLNGISLYAKNKKNLMKHFWDNLKISLPKMS